MGEIQLSMFSSFKETFKKILSFWERSIILGYSVIEGNNKKACGNHIFTFVIQIPL